MKINYQKNALWFHFGFWVIYFLVAFSIFIVFFDIQFAVIRVVANGLAHAILIYATLYFFIPRFFMKGKHILHYLLLGLLLAIISVTRVHLDNLLNGPAGIIPIEMFSWMHYGGKALSGLIVIGFSTSFKFIEYWYEQQKKEQEVKAANWKLSSDCFKHRSILIFFSTHSTIFILCLIPVALKLLRLS